MPNAHRKFIKQLIVFGFIVFPSSFTFAATVLIHNTLSQNEEGSLLEVDSVTTKEGVKARYRLRIYPSETKELSSADLLGFQVSRIFENHRLKYEVTCHETPNSIPITFDISSIHEDKLGPECKLTGYGHWSRRTGFNWIIKKKSILDRYKKKK